MKATQVRGLHSKSSELQLTNHQLTHRSQRVEHSHTSVGDRFIRGRSHGVEVSFEDFQGQRVAQVALVVLHYHREFEETLALLGQVAGQLLQRPHVLSQLVALRIGHEHHTVRTVQHRHPCALVKYLAGYGVQVEARLVAMHAAQVERQEVEEQRTLGLSINREQVASCLARHSRVYVLQVRGLTGQAGTVVHNFAVYLSSSNVY